MPGLGVPLGDIAVSLDYIAVAELLKKLAQHPIGFLMGNFDVVIGSHFLQFKQGFVSIHRVSPE